jgi:two-component system sensor histidine kinase/response regulator
MNDSPPAGRAQRRMRALLADDDKTMRAVAHDLLQELGVEVSVGTNGKEALQLFEQEQAQGRNFDIVCLDMRMPELNGALTSKALREKGFQGPIVVFTATATMSNKKESTTCGVTRYFSKNHLTKEILSAVIDEYCRS